MTPERWREVERICEAALACEPAGRAAYVAAACDGDEALRQEVESLLAHAASAERFIEAPAIAAAGALTGVSGLHAGQRLGSYHIVGKIGAGGMGEVYRARDTELGRDVAVKIVPPVFAADAERLARFDREARVLASLNHPHIASLYGIHAAVTDDGQPVRALVMELVEGPTLAERIARGPVPIAEALPIARQIAEALAAAHEKGIVHRDLKPANIKLTAHGAVKVLDFGLAKAATPGPGDADPSHSPTLTAGGTHGGVLLGTAAYMSPEQARGQAVDARADIWAFGCVLYEMLTGRVAFSGDTTTDVLAHVIERDPDWTRLPSNAPPAVHRLVRRCLTKDPRDRLHAIADARLDIDEALRPHGEQEAAVASPTSHTARIAPIVLAVGVTALVLGVATWRLAPLDPIAEPLVARSIISEQPFDERPPAVRGQPDAAIRPFRTWLALSPDGRTLVFGAAREGQPASLFLRPLDSLTATAIPDTDRPYEMFFSPDGRWIAFWQAGEIRRVPVAGGPPSTIARVPGSGERLIFGASWGDDDTIIFATVEGLWRVPASGGSPEQVTRRGEGGVALHKLPHILPGGQSVLFTVQKTDQRWDDADIVVRSLATGDQKVLLTDGADARYVPTGHLLFMRRGTLMAVAFDLPRLEVTGAPIALIDDVMQAANLGGSLQDSGVGQFAVAAQGRLVYVTGGMRPEQRSTLAWIDRDGNVEPLSPLPPGWYFAPRLSPDGLRVALHTGTSANGGRRVWTYDLARRTLTPFTSQEEQASWAVWSPDGRQVAYTRRPPPDRSQVTLRSADGAGTPTVVASLERASLVPAAWSVDGTIAIAEITSAGGNDISMVDPRSPNGRVQRVLATSANEQQPAVSPDGKWLAYTSNDSGAFEVYVQPYPGPGPRVLVSVQGGVAPAWRGGGDELYYHTLGSAVVMWAVPVTTAKGQFVAGTPRRLFEHRFVATTPARGYDVTADGARFLVVQPEDNALPPVRPQMVLVENWLEELKRRVLPHR